MLQDITENYQDAITIPYSFTDHPWAQNPAVATEDAIFYAVNPYWQIHKAFIAYCNDPTELGLLQLSPISSFSPITIWRVYPYVYCPPSQEAGCYEDLFSGISIGSKNSINVAADQCDSQMIDFAVTGIQYINLENIAISVLRTTVADFDLETMSSRNGNGTTITYFLNTITMQIRENIAWDTEVPQAVLTQGQLCPDQRRLPQVGSIFTESLVATIQFLHMPFNLLLNGVYIFDSWKNHKECPLITRGHTLLSSDSCGADALSLKPFFDSMTRMDQMVFRSISLVARMMKGFKGSDMSRTFLNGVKIVGESTKNPISPRGTNLITKLFNGLPLDQIPMDIITSTFRMPKYMRVFVIAANPLNIADFMYHFLVEMIYRIVSSQSGPSSIFYQTMYDFQVRLSMLVAFIITRLISPS
jgi:hypothetical protein